jgi:DNA repair protein RadD
VVTKFIDPVFRHGFVEDRVEWTLDPDKRATNPVHVARLAGGNGSRLLECSQCTSIRVAGEACQKCGFLPHRPPRAIVFRDGDLVRVDRRARKTKAVSDPNEQMRWHAMLAYIAEERGYKIGWVAHKFKQKFGHWPPTCSVTPIAPSPEVLSWVRSRNIAYAKARKAVAA